MSLNADFGEMEAAAQDLRAILANLSEGNALAAPPTTGILPAGLDEISAAITALLNGHGAQFQAVAAQAQSFGDEFTANLKASASTFQSTEEANGQTLRNESNRLEQPLDPTFEKTFGSPPDPSTITAPAVPQNSSVGIVIGGTNEPFTTWLLGKVEAKYPMPPNSYLLWTPENFFPLTPEYGDLTMQQSVNAGVSILNNEVMTQLAAGNHVTVWTTSQSSIIATEEVRNLMAHGDPGVGKLSFIMTGDPNNPDGGILSRFTYGNGATIKFLQIPFNGSTPANSPYQTAIYSNEYDAISNFPEYPLNVISDANAIIGASDGQHDYASETRTYYQLPTSPGYTGNTTYCMALTQHLPLLDPLSSLGTPGNTLADLLQPDLRVIVDMGYGSNEYANIPTPASLFEIPDPFTIVPDLAKGVVQGIDAAGVDMHLLPHSMYPTTYPFMPELNPGLNFPLPQTSAAGMRH